MSKCEMCSTEIPKDGKGEPENEFFCSPSCADNYVASWE